MVMPSVKAKPYFKLAFENIYWCRWHTLKSDVHLIYKHTAAWTKCLLFCRQHFQMHFAERTFLHFGSNFTEVHYIDVIMTVMASQITSLTVVYSTVYSDADQRKHQSSASLAFVWGIHRDRWIPRTKGQLRGKVYHLMTSSCCSYDVPMAPLISL